MSKDVRNDSNELAEHGIAVCGWATTSTLNRCYLSPFSPTYSRFYVGHAHTHARTHGRLTILSFTHLISSICFLSAWLNPSGRFQQGVLQTHMPLKSIISACTWKYAHRWIWKGNVMPAQHLTLMPALLPILTTTLYSLHELPPLSHTHTHPFHLFSSVKMKIRHPRCP